MLATQVQYWNYMENQRHNLATEEQMRKDLVETSRSNRVREAISQGTLNESVRHNKAVENLNWSGLAETTRHNTQQEQIGFANVAETKRHNEQQETLYPYQRDKYQMETTTGYVDAGVDAADKIGRGTGPLSKGLLAAGFIAGMVGASDVSHSRKGNQTYGAANTKGTKPGGKGTTHYGARPSLSDSDKQKYIRF